MLEKSVVNSCPRHVKNKVEGFKLGSLHDIQITSNERRVVRNVHTPDIRSLKVVVGYCYSCKAPKTKKVDTLGTVKRSPKGRKEIR